MSLLSNFTPRMSRLGLALMNQLWYCRILTVPYIVFLVIAGKTVLEKLTDVRAVLTENSAFALVITALDEVAWLFNIRGGDVNYNPGYQMK